MARISTLDLDKAEPKAKEILDGVNKALGTVPNVFKTFAHSPAVLEAYMGFSGAMAKAKLPATVREQIALTVALVVVIPLFIPRSSPIHRKGGEIT